MKLIDKDALVAEIEKMVSNGKAKFQQAKENNAHVSYVAWSEHIATCEKILFLLDTLETKEEILDEEGKTKLMKKCVHKAYKRGYDMGVLKTISEMNHNIKEVDLEKEIEKCLKHNRIVAVGRKDFTEIAKHFFELGIKAQKGE